LSNAGTKAQREGGTSSFNGITANGGQTAGFSTGFDYGRGGVPNGANGGYADGSGTPNTGNTGYTSSISGSSYVYSSGGGGGSNTSSTNSGGTGAGAGGSNNNGTSPTNGTNYGSGGGGGGVNGCSTLYYGADGAPGVVIISYAGSAKYTGGTISSAGGNTIHTFTANGTLTLI
jgi:hypothetical protein